MFSSMTPGMEDFNQDDELVYSEGEDNAANSFDFDEEESSVEDNDFKEDPYEEKYGDLNDKWLDENYEDNLSIKFSRNARYSGDW